MMKNDNFKSGFAALVGRPNVGKSMLLNFFLKEKLSIISAKPQTTRDNLLGILSAKDSQVIFIDTPGVHNPKNKLGEYMVNCAVSAGTQADEIMMVIDAAEGITEEDSLVYDVIAKNKISGCNWRALLLNKIDLVNKENVSLLIENCKKVFKFDDYIPVSALTGQGMDTALRKIISHLPAGPEYYPSEQLTDKSERYIAAEMIREQVLDFCREEVPHAVAVQIEAFKDNPGRKTLIRANIYLEKESQKHIVIGKDGRMLKKIGSAARVGIEKLIGRPVYLELWVKVRENWRKDEVFLKSLGYEFM